MKRKIWLVGAALLLCAGAARAHDLFLKLETYFLEPGQEVSVELLNGTFEASESGTESLISRPGRDTPSM